MNQFNIFQVSLNKKSQHLFCVCVCVFCFFFQPISSAGKYFPSMASPERGPGGEQWLRRRSHVAGLRGAVPKAGGWVPQLGSVIKRRLKLQQAVHTSPLISHLSVAVWLPRSVTSGIRQMSKRGGLGKPVPDTDVSAGGSAPSLPAQAELEQKKSHGRCYPGLLGMGTSS